MNRGRSFLCCLLAVLVALATAAGTALARGPGCCCDGVCPLKEAMAKAGVECSMADGSSCALERTPKGPGSGAQARDALQPAILSAAVGLLPPAYADPAAGSAAGTLPSVPHAPETPPPRSS
jgi:hypothetical protein